MKHICPFCNTTMMCSAEKQWFGIKSDIVIDYVVYKCEKPKCNIGLNSKCKIWKHQNEVQGISIILDLGLKKYKFVSRYDLNKTCLSRVGVSLGFNNTKSVSLDMIVSINESIKIDLTDPINSGLLAVDRLLKLRAFS